MAFRCNESVHGSRSCQSAPCFCRCQGTEAIKQICMVIAFCRFTSSAPQAASAIEPIRQACIVCIVKWPFLGLFFRKYLKAFQSHDDELPRLWYNIADFYTHARERSTSSRIWCGQPLRLPCGSPRQLVSGSQITDFKPEDENN
jgi:hypothetical protein